MTSYDDVILIECNRLQDPSIQLNQDNDAQIRDNHTWSVDLKENLLLERGTRILIEQSAINSIGNGETQIEFSGTSNNNQISDNLAKISFAYYINNNHQFLLPLPKRNSTIRSLFHSYRWEKLQPSTNSKDTLEFENDANTLLSPFSRYYGSPFLKKLKNEVAGQSPFKFDFCYKQHFPVNNIENTVLNNIKNNAPSFDRFYIGKDNLSSIYDNEDKTIDGVDFSSIWDFKTSETEFKIDRGFSTPEMVSSKLTNDLHKLSIYKDFITEDNEFMPPYISNDVDNKNFFDINNFTFNTTDSVSKLIPTCSFIDNYMRDKYFPTKEDKLFYSKTTDYTEELGKLYGSTHLATNQPHRLKASCELSQGIIESKGFSTADINGLNQVIDDAFLEKYNYYSGFRDGFVLTENGNIGCNIVIADFLKSKINETPSINIRTTPNGNNIAPTTIDQGSHHDLQQELYYNFTGVDVSTNETGFTSWNGIDLINSSAVQYLNLKDGDLVFTNLVANENNFKNIKKVFDLIKRPNNETNPALYNNNDDNYKKQLVALLDIGAIQDDTMANNSNRYFFNYNSITPLGARTTPYDFCNLLPPAFNQPIETDVSGLNQNQFNNLNYVYNVFPSTLGNLQDNNDPTAPLLSGTGTGIIPTKTNSNIINYDDYSKLHTEQFKSLYVSHARTTLEQARGLHSDDGETFFLNQSGLDESEGYKIKVRTDWTNDIDPSLVDLNDKLASNTDKSYTSSADVIFDNKISNGKEKVSLFSLKNSKGEFYDVNKYGENSIKQLGIGIVVGYRKTLINGLYNTKHNNEIVDTSNVVANFSANYVDFSKADRVGNFPIVPNTSVGFLGTGFGSLVNPLLNFPLKLEGLDSSLNSLPITTTQGLEIVYEYSTPTFLSQMKWWNSDTNNAFPEIYELYGGVDNSSFIEWDLLVEADQTSHPNVSSTTSSATTSAFNNLLDFNDNRKKYTHYKIAIKKVQLDVQYLEIGCLELYKYDGGLTSSGISKYVGTEKPPLKDVPFIAFVYKGNRDNNLKIPTPMLFEKFGISKSYGDIQQSLITSTQKKSYKEESEKVSVERYYNTTDTDYSQYSTYINIGASLSQFQFNQDTQKINLNNLHTPIYSGQTQYNFNDNIDETKTTPAGTNPAPNPQPQVIQQRNCFDEGIFYYYSEDGSMNNDQEEQPDTNVYKPRGSSIPYGLISSQTGIGIKDIFVGFRKILDSVQTNYIKLDRNNYKLYYNGSLFNKLGFKYEQLRPFYNNNFIMYSRSHQNRYLNNYDTEYNKFRNQLSPLTTNGLVASSNNIGLCSNQSGLPLFLLGNPSRFQTSITQVEDYVESVKLPTKLSYPYLVVKSNIIQNNRSFIDGSGNYTNGIGVIGRQYSSNDYFYSFANDWEYVVDKPYILSKINVGIYTSIGTPAPIDENSSIIFKIIKTKEFFTEEDLDKKNVK